MPRAVEAAPESASLGFSIDDMPPFEPSTDLSAVEVTGGAAGAPLAPPSVELAAPPSSSLGGPDGVSQPTTVRGERAGSSSNKRSD